ncbi:hypothetical protein BU16DRAFT_384067 [Lophium mytilinum]|uniref:Uncharacterized protein n=1 Tax=Lophium mytilinum TaxID=390894 RepID=A0A6A6QU09_9PEZI|nr:hypothetical protein BU16DRAFT_384067 [Lophium mytilinum]
MGWYLWIKTLHISLLRAGGSKTSRQYYFDGCWACKIRSITMKNGRRESGGSKRDPKQTPWGGCLGIQNLDTLYSWGWWFKRADLVLRMVLGLQKQPHGPAHVKGGGEDQNLRMRDLMVWCLCIKNLHQQSATGWWLKNDHHWSDGVGVVKFARCFDARGERGRGESKSSKHTSICGGFRTWKEQRHGLVLQNRRPGPLWCWACKMRPMLQVMWRRGGAGHKHRKTWHLKGLCLGIKNREKALSWGSSSESETKPYMVLDL